MKSERDDSKGGVEVGAVRAPVAEPAPLPCPSGAEAHNLALLAGHRCTACGVARQDAAEPAPVETRQVWGWCNVYPEEHVDGDHHPLDPRPANGEPAPREPSAPAATRCSACKQVLACGCDARQEPNPDDFVPQHFGVDGRGDERMPPPTPTDDPGDELTWQPAPDRAAWLMLPVSLVGAETISGPRYNELASVARGLHIRVAELEAANEGLAQIVNARAAAPPPGTVAALLAVVDAAAKKAEAVAEAREYEAQEPHSIGVAVGLREAARLITATLGAPTPLDRAVGEVCAVDVGPVARGPFGATVDALNAITDMAMKSGNADGTPDPERNWLRRIVKVGLLALACDAPATKEPG